jgi:glycosyltransferase involved in cell wall biosynthesis
MSIASSGASPDGGVPVAVVIPCYRARATLRRALDSVLRQTARPRELIAVDDASGDGSWEELQRIQGEIGADRLRILRLERNLGPAAARNAGWDAAGAELIAFLDADDTWHPSKLELQARFMREHPEFALSGHRHVRDGRYAALPAGLPYVEIGARELLLSNRFVTPSVMLRRELRQRFRAGQRHMEDHLLWLQLALRGQRLARIELGLASLYKPQFGAAGQSAELWAMESAELGNYRLLRREGLIGGPRCAMLSLWSGAKFLRRLVITAARHGR